MLQTIRVRDYMSRNLITVSPDMPVNEAIRVLLRNAISGAPVVENSKLVGIFSESDCLKGAIQAGYHGEEIGSVREFMSAEVQTVGPEDSVLHAADIFLKQRRRRLPVVEDGELIGQISRHDVLRAMDDFAAKRAG